MKPSSVDAFHESLKFSTPPNQWSKPLQALWWDAKGNWNASHDIAQELHTPMGSWIHAYLHRKEGDDWNAGYWYRRAGRTFPEITVDTEFLELIVANL